MPEPLINNVGLIEAEELDPEEPGLLVHVAEATAFSSGHIPGAVNVTPGELIGGVPPATGRLPSINRLHDLFSRLGYRQELNITAYDDEGGGWAGRFLWTLDVIGHQHWLYLNGGLHAWLAAGRPLAHGLGHRPTPTPVHLTPDYSPVAEVEDVLQAMGDPIQAIWDVRSLAEFRGERRTAKHAGHVPGAIHLDWLALKDPHDRQRLVPNLRKLLQQHSITGEQAIITHCQTHHRSGLSYLVGRLLGFSSIRAYHGSWSEWGNLDNVPVAIGDAEAEVLARRA